MTVDYVLGFMFDKKTKQVLLIMKNRPKWQRGKLNGIGGHIEPRDKSPKHAMAREFKEETGIETIPDKWGQVCLMSGIDWNVYVFRTFNDDIFNYQNRTDEKCRLEEIKNLPEFVIPNLRWLIPFSLDADISKETIIKYN